MKKYSLIILVIHLSFFLPDLFLYADYGKVIFYDGTPTLLRKLKKLEIKLGDPIEINDQILTSQNDKVTIETPDGHRIYVLASSKLKITSPKNNNIQVEQELGSLWFKLNPLTKEESFTVKTPSSVVGVRGTKFITMILENNVTSLCVCEGQVSIEAKGHKSTVSTGYGSLATENGLSETTSNKTFITNKRRMSRKPACLNCHDTGYNSSGKLDGDGLILR